MVAHVSTPIGTLLAAATPRGVRVLEFSDPAGALDRAAEIERHHGDELKGEPNDILTLLKDEIGRYFDGALRTFRTPVDPQGTSFQLRVWEELRRIPYGEVRSYEGQALALDAPKAIRAVAQANGRNPIAIVVPCHRIVGKDGSLTGYGGGLERKRYLLELEGAFSRNLFATKIGAGPAQAEQADQK